MPTEKAHQFRPINRQFARLLEIPIAVQKAKNARSFWSLPDPAFQMERSPRPMSVCEPTHLKAFNSAKPPFWLLRTTKNTNYGLQRYAGSSLFIDSTLILCSAVCYATLTPLTVRLSILPRIKSVSARDCNCIIPMLPQMILKSRQSRVPVRHGLSLDRKYQLVSDF